MTTNISQLTPEELNEIKAKLLENKTQVQEELEKFGHKKDGTYEALYPELGNKDDENAEEVAAYSANLSLERELESSLRDVQAALKRIKENKYGICKYCGQPIDEKRLLARPESSTCVDCKKRLKGENIK